MAFINEYISDVDKAKYGIREIDIRYVIGGTSSDQWTVDKTRDIYLRQVARGSRENRLFGGVWTLFFEQELIEIGIDQLESIGGIGKDCWSHKRLSYINLPEPLATRKSEVIDVLREALLVYGDGGVYSECKSYSFTLDE